MTVFTPSASVAQSASAPSVAAPAPLPPDSQVPAETTAPGPGASAPGNQSVNHGASAMPKPSAGEPRPSAARSLLPGAARQNTAIAAILIEARRAIDRRQTIRAEDALERAETAMLQRSVSSGEAASPDSSPGVMHVAAARTALAKHDYATAKKAIAAALLST